MPGELRQFPDRGEIVADMRTEERMTRLLDTIYGPENVRFDPIMGWWYADGENGETVVIETEWSDQ
jgi:hypothetical protein